MANPVTYGNPGTTYGQVGVTYGTGNDPNYPLSDRWTVDGFPLQTYAYNIATWGGSRQAPPPLRGENVLIPHSAGRRWLPKEVDSRTITLGMWVVGADPDGTVRDRAKFESNWRQLRRMLWTPEREVRLGKSFTDDNGSLVSCTALAQFAGGLEPEMNGRMRAAFTVDMFLADPFFYGSRDFYNLTMAAPLVTTPARGDAPTKNIKVTFTGPLTSPRLTNPDLSQECWVQYDGVLATGESVELDVRRYRALRSPGGVKVVGKVSHGGDYAWLKIGQARSGLKLTALAGTGGATVEVLPAWL